MSSRAPSPFESGREASGGPLSRAQGEGGAANAQATMPLRDPSAARAVVGDHGCAVQRFTITIKAPLWEDVQDIELPELPGEGDAIETRYGTCIVTRVESLPDSTKYAGRIVCRFP